ncbi:MAG: hypothetical protein AB7O37_22645 [Vicinamibacteria bacterium]
MSFNLASRPFRNDTLPNLGFGLACAAALVFSGWHARVLLDLHSAESRARRQGLVTYQKQLESLRAEAKGLRAPEPEKATLDSWRAVAELVDRRLFSWTALLERLERVLPPGVRLVSIAPAIEGPLVRLQIDAIARSREEGLSLIRVFGEAGFDEVMPLSMSSGDEGERFVYRIAWDTRARPAAAGARP